MAGKIGNFNAAVMANGGTKTAHIPVTYGPISNPSGDVAAAANVDFNDPRNDAILWDPTAVQKAVNNGQDPYQIAYHELDHILNSLVDPVTNLRRVPAPASDSRGPDANFPANGMATASIGGSTFTYNLNNYSQYYAYEHTVVHNDLVRDFGNDKTGALLSATAGIARTDASGNPLPTMTTTDAAGFAKANATAFAGLSLPPRDWDYEAAGTCSTTSSSKRSTAAAGRRTSSIVEGFDGNTAVYVDHASYSP